MATTIKNRRDTAANWTSVNPVLNSGEIGVETDTRYFKIGDGVTAWTSLAYSGRMDGSGDLDMGNNSINNLLSLTYKEDGGALTGADMSVTASPAAATEESYAFKIDGTIIAKVYAEADGAGGIQNPRFEITKASIGATQGDYGLALINTTNAAAGAQQYSPPIRWRGEGWKTDATAASQTVDFRAFVRPIQGAAAPTGGLDFQSSINGGAYSDLVTIRASGAVGIGTTSPGAKFHLNNSAGVAAQWTTCKNDATSYSQMVFGAGTDLAGGYAEFLKYTASHTLAGLFTIDNQTNKRVSINESSSGDVSLAVGGGNVGIGTTSPGAKLVISGGTVDPLSLRGTPAGAAPVSFSSENTNAANFKNQFTFKGNGANKWSFGNDVSGNGGQNFFFYDEVGAHVVLYFDNNANVGIGTTGQFGGGAKVIGLVNAGTVPTSNPTGGGVLYAEGGALKWRGSSGTVTTIAPA